MKRWERSLRKQADILNKRISLLVSRLLILAQQAKHKQSKLEVRKTTVMELSLDKTYSSMAEIIKALLCVEDIAKLRWPEITYLFDSFKEVLATNKESNEETEQSTKI